MPAPDGPTVSRRELRAQRMRAAAEPRREAPPAKRVPEPGSRREARALKTAVAATGPRREASPAKRASAAGPRIVPLGSERRGAPPRRHPAAARSARGNPGNALALAALAVGIAVMSAVAALLAPGTGSAAARPPAVLINQVMTNNPDLCLPVDERYYDWLELVNTGSEDVNLAGWRLTNRLDLRGACVFGDVVLPANGGSLTVYCDAEPEDHAGDEVFSGFRLNSNGLSLMLASPGEREIQVLEVPPMRPAHVYQRDGATGEYAVEAFFDSEAGREMLEEELTPDHRADSVYISELMPNNDTNLLDGDGDFSDWVELCNGTAEPVDLAGWSLSDDDMDRRRWVFPGVTLGAGEYLVVFASGKDRADPAGELHAGFRLASGGETLRLYTPQGEVSSWAEYGAAAKDVSIARNEDGALEAAASASPGFPNTSAGAKQALQAMYTPLTRNERGLYINEIFCAGKGFDWVEIHNAGGEAADLSGYGLSDTLHRPRKWQFPQGTVVKPGGYLVVYLTGDGGKSGIEGNRYYADFALSGGETAVLAEADGRRVDSVRLLDARRDLGYGRAKDKAKYRYFATPTPGKANSERSYARQAHEVKFSAVGGAYKQTSLSLKLSAESGMTIYYTLDGSEPTSKSKVYTGPLTLKECALVKAVAWKKDALKSPTVTYSYVLGASHSLRVVNIIGSKEKLIGSSGVLRTGDKTEQQVYVEVYEPDGTRLISQSCGLKLSGHYSRVHFDQKGFSLRARKKYGEGKFHAALFRNRDYTEYDSLFMRASGEDANQTHMRDSILASLAADTSVYYQETELCAVYVNGRYWGEYNMRERVSPDSIAQFEGWDNPDDIVLLEGSGDKLYANQGSAKSFKSLMAKVRKMDLSKDSNVEKLREYVDVENYLEYVALQMYTANQDLNNVRCYCNPRKGGRWRWVLADLDLSYQVDANSIARWLKSGGVGSITAQDNTLFIRLMKNAKLRDYFLTRMGRLLATSFSAQNVTAKIRARYKLLKSEMALNCRRWGWSTSTWKKYCAAMVKYAQSRPTKLMGYFRKTLKLSDKQMKKYFGDAMAKAKA